jgi:hypothetical protein
MHMVLMRRTTAGVSYFTVNDQNTITRILPIQTYFYEISLFLYCAVSNTKIIYVHSRMAQFLITYKIIVWHMIVLNSSSPID